MIVSEIPPWANDPNPECWIELRLAAVEYFRKHPTYLRFLANRGELPGAQRFMGQWYIKLPRCALIDRISKERLMR